jgi:molybdate transport system substrate-binding protein
MARMRIALTVLALVTANSALAQTTVRVAAAADLEPVLPAILSEFQQATGIHAEATYQASATLTAQMENGAPFDVFLSADMSYPQRLIDAGLAAGAKFPTIYARGTLVLWTRKDSGLPASLETLKSAKLQRLAIANPERAPYGRAAVAALTKLGLYDALKPRLVTAANIAQAAQFADSGNADAGLISMTSAQTERLKASGTYFVVPRDLYPAIEQGAVVLKRTQMREGAAQKLLAFLLSKRVQAELKQRGLEPAQ